MNAQELLQHARSDLTREERTALALDLLDDADSRLEVAQLLESARRMDAIRSGAVKAIDGDQAFAMIRERLGIQQGA